MTDARLEEILRIIDDTSFGVVGLGLPPDDMTDEEARYCIDEGLVTVAPLTGLTTHAYTIHPGRVVGFQDLPKHQPIGDLTSKGQRRLADLQERFGTRGPRG